MPQTSAQRSRAYRARQRALRPPRDQARSARVRMADMRLRDQLLLQAILTAIRADLADDLNQKD
jgi:hypothetical protein